MLFFIFVPMIAIGVAATRSNFTGGEKFGIAILAIVVGLIASLAPIHRKDECRGVLKG